MGKWHISNKHYHIRNVTIDMPKNLITLRMSVTYKATYNIQSIIVNEQYMKQQALHGGTITFVLS